MDVGQSHNRKRLPQCLQIRLMTETVGSRESMIAAFEVVIHGDRRQRTEQDKRQRDVEPVFVHGYLMPVRLAIRTMMCASRSGSMA